MKFLSAVKEVKAKVDAKGNSYVEMKLDAIRCADINLEEAKGMVGKTVRVQIDRVDRALPGMEEA